MERVEVRLDELALHQLGIVAEIDASDDEMARLMAMGVCEGRVIELVKGGSPMILKVFGSRIGVSTRLARRILVKPCDKFEGEIPNGR
ncbi:MAG: ferrous iron transport protein A [Verrucomicrobia bacterium]|nr:ferrous iron transport protein A [Verrucomicrobiota bacterium]